MTTYNMKFNAKIESIHTESRQMVVEYFDPHGHESRRLALMFKYDSTAEDIKQIVIDNTPHVYFHNRNEEIKAIQEKNINLEELNVLVGESIEYNLPTYDNEVV